MRARKDANACFLRVCKIPASSTARVVVLMTPLLAQLSGRQKRHVPEKLLALVSNPSFREARAGDARWETTRDDDGNGVGEWLCGCGWKRVLHRL